MARKVNIASIAAEHRAKSQLDSATTLQGHDAITRVDADDFDRVMTSAVIPSAPKPEPIEDERPGEPVKGRDKASKLLPHDSVYMHPNVRQALRRYAVDKHVRLQVVLRAAVQEWMDRNGINLDVESGKKRKA